MASIIVPTLVTNRCLVPFVEHEFGEVSSIQNQLQMDFYLLRAYICMMHDDLAVSITNTFHIRN